MATKKLNRLGKQSHSLPIMVVIFSLFLVGLGLKFYADYNQRTRISEVLKVVFKVTQDIADERTGSQRAWNSNSVSTADLNLKYTDRFEFSPRGVLMIRFNGQIIGFQGKWLFMVPAVRVAGEEFEYVDLSQGPVNSTTPMFWVCGVPQKGGIPKSNLPDTCNNYLGPEYRIPK
jgi:hypothetical protein